MKNSCPNFNSPEWKSLENNPLIGKFEAMRDWLENDGVIRTPEEVIKKISDRNMGFNKPGNQLVQEVKPGVEELFESNPELANAVYEALVPTGYTRLYRAENEKGVDTPAPLWLLEQPEIVAQQEAQGRWFYKSYEEAKYHADKFGSSGISYIDVPTNIVEQFNAKDNKFAGGYGKEGKEYFVSKEIAVNKKSFNPQQAQQLYSQYLGTIFPNSQVKDIVYHGSKDKFDKFDKSKLGQFTGAESAKKGFFFAGNYNTSLQYVIKLSIDIAQEQSKLLSQRDISVEDGLYLKDLQDQYNAVSNKATDELVNFLTSDKFPPDFTYNVDSLEKLKNAVKWSAEDIGADVNEYLSEFDTIAKEIQSYVRGVVINITNPISYDFKQNENYQTRDISFNTLLKNKTNEDGAIFKNVYDPLLDNIYVTFEPDQIHILGSNQDIEGFKSFVQNKQLVTPRQGISELFAENPQLASIGTQEQYERYLSTIFPNSKVKDIVYHSRFTVGNIKNKDRWKNGFYSGTKDQADLMADMAESGSNDLMTTSALLINMQNPKVTTYTDRKVEDYKNTNDGFIIEATEKDALQLIGDRDGYNIENFKKEYVVFEPEQIHILGSKQDIEKFKQFVSDQSTIEDAYDQLREEFIRENSIQEIEPNLSEEDRSLSIVFQIAEKLSNKLRVPFQIITSDKAFELTAGTQNPWKGQKAFFLGGTVYFVGNNIDFETQFHEFAHPFVRALMVENPRLMNDLYEKFIATPEGRVILQQTLDEYSGVPDNSGIVKEEVLVKAIQLSASKKAQGIKPDNILPTLIQRFFTGLRSFLNKLFGKKPVSRINENSTLYDLAEILLDDEQFELDATKITQSDIVAYQNNNAELIKSIMDVTNDNAAPVFEIVKDMYDKARGTIRAMNPIKDKELIQALKDEYQRGDLYDLTQNLNKLKLELEKDLELTKDRANRFVATLSRVENMVTKLREHIKVMNSDLSDLSKKQNLDYIKKLKYYENIINYWSNFTKTTMDVFNDDLKLKPDDPIFSFVNTIDKNLELARQEAQGDDETGYLKGVGQVLWEQWEGMAERNDKYYTDIIRALQLNGAPKSQIEAYHKEYYGLTISEKQTYDRLNSSPSLSKKDKDQLKLLKKQMYTEGVILTKEKILETLKGNLGDSNYFNGWLEGYMYQSDVVIGGFSKFLKDALIDVNVKSFDNFYNQTEVLKPLLKALGYTQRDQGKLGREIGFKDKRGYEENGEIKEREVWSFIDKFQDVDLTISQKKLEISKLKAEYDRTRDSEVEKQLNQKKTEYLEYLRKWFHQPYTDAFYAKDDIFKNSAEGAAAKEMRDNWFNDLNSQTDPDLAHDDEAVVSENLRELRIRYKEMYSYYDRNGNLKEEFDRKVTDILIKHRELTRNFYEERERIGVFENEFNAFKDRLITVELLDPVTQADEIRRREDEWLKENTYQRLEVDENGSVIYYKVLREKIQQLNAIKDRMPQGDKQREAMEKISKLLDQQISMVNISKDDNNTPDGTVLSEEQIDTLADIQEQINSLRQDILNVNGFTKKESAQLRGLYRLLDSGRPGINQLISSLYATAKARKRKAGISNEDLKRYNLLVQEISDMSSKEPTEYYLDILNDKIKNIEGLPDDFILKNFGQDVNEITKNNVDRLYENVLGSDNEVLKEIFKASPEFKTWFEKNHYQEVYYDRDREAEIEVWKRLNIWTVKTPVGDEYYKKREITYSNGDVVTINRIPNYKYIRKVVKKEYVDENGNTVQLKTEKIVGKTITNTKEWLPKELPDSPFRNERYYELKNASPDSRDGKLFKLLEKVKEFHLKNQEGKPIRSRLYYDFPRFEASLYERIITSKEDRERGISDSLKESFPIFSYIFRRIRQFFEKAKDDGLDTLNPDLDYDLVRVTSEDVVPVNIPVHGLYNIPIQDVSTDFITSMYAYSSSLIKQEKLIEIHPIAKALDQVLKTNSPKGLEEINKRNFVNDTIGFSTNVRSNIYETLLKREFYGERLLGFFKDNKTAQSISKFIFGRASLAMFALNVPAALKDFFGSKYQKMLLMSGGKYIDPKSVAKGEVWAYKVMSEKSFGSVSEGMGPQIYQIGAKTLNVQLTELFQVSMKDPREGFIRAASRSLPSDVLSMSWLYNFREWLQGQSEASLFGAMMYKQTVYQYDKPIAYMDAWEIRDGVLTIKEGIDPDYGPRKTTHLFVKGDTIDSIATRYNIPVDELKKRLGLENLNDIEPGTELTIATGAKFKDMVNKFNIVQQSLEGNYANMNQPLAQGYLAFRAISYIKKYFTTMFVERFAFTGNPLSGNIRPRYNPGLDELKMGFYVSTIRNLYRLSRNTSQQWAIMNQEERFNMLRMPLEIMGMVFVQSLLLPLFGFDIDDDEKYEKLREKSGDLPLPFIAEDPEHPFKLMGWLENHALLLAMNVRSENEAFIPLPGFGLDDYTQFLNFQSLAFGPTIESYSKMAALSYSTLTGSERAYYKRDSGPYEWQQEGGSKLITTLAKSIGIDGSNASPVEKIKQKVAIQILSEGG